MNAGMNEGMSGGMTEGMNGGMMNVQGTLHPTKQTSPSYRQIVTYIQTDTHKGVTLCTQKYSTQKYSS